MIETQTYFNSNIEQNAQNKANTQMQQTLTLEELQELVADAKAYLIDAKARLNAITMRIDSAYAETEKSRQVEFINALQKGDSQAELTLMKLPNEEDNLMDEELQLYNHIHDMEQNVLKWEEMIKNLNPKLEVPGPQSRAELLDSTPHVKNRELSKTHVEAPGPQLKSKRLSSKPHVKNRVSIDSSDSSSDSGNMSDDSVKTIMEKTYIDGLYQPNIVSIEKLPTWEQVMSNHVSEEPFTELTTIISESVGNTWFSPLFGEMTPLLVSALGTSLLSIGTCLSTLFQKTSTVNKVLNVTTIVSSLVTLVLTITHLLKQVGISFNSSKVITEIPKVAQDFTKNENQSNSAAWIYPAISTIVSLLIGGLTLFSVCDIKSIIEKGMLIRSGQHISGMAKTVTKFLLEDLLHLDITGDQEVFNDLHKWAKRSAELATLPFLDFLRNTSLMLELQNAVEKSLPILTAKYYNKEMNTVSRGAFVLITQNLSKLSDKLAAIKVILAAVKRQETLGVLFAGEASVGKSTLAQYAAKKMAEKLGYDPRLYNLNMSRKDGFYGPYGGQDFGTIDEFMALRQEDPNLPQMNQILSGDHFNLEAAHLEGKSQPSALKCVFLTSNNLCPSLIKVLDTEAAKATWDRILRFEVIDPKIKGRQGLNDHRRPDFSHLRFRFVESTRELVPTNLVYREVTIDEVLGMILFQIAKREENYITQHQLQTAALVEQERLQKRLSFLESIKNANASNSGQCFKVMRVQGPLGTGKTRIVNKIVHNILRAYIGWKRYDVFDFSTPPTTRGIYVIDDILMTNRECYEAYLQWINRGHTNNLYIIVTNDVFTRHKTITQIVKQMIYRQSCYQWRVDTKGAPCGVARRLGLHGNILTDNGSVVMTGNESVTIDVPRRGIYSFNGEELSETEIINFTYRTFESYVVETNEVQVVDESYEGPNDDFDATITCDSVKHLNSVFRSKFKIITSCMTKTNGVAINFKPDLFNTVIKSFEDATQMMPGNINDEESLVANALNIASILNDVCPGVKSRLFIEDTRREIILYNRRLYIGQVDAEVFRVHHDAMFMRIMFWWNGVSNSISYEEYTQFVRMGKMPEGMKGLPSTLISAINSYVNANISKTDPLFKYHDWYSTILKKESELAHKGLLHFIKDNKVLSLIVGLVSLGTLVGLSTLMYKIFKKEEREEVVSNAHGGSSGGGKTDDDEYVDQNIREHVQKFKAAILNNPDEAYRIREEVYERGFKAEWNRFENDFRSNSMTIHQEFKSAMSTGNLTRMRQIIKDRPEELKHALKHSEANNLTVHEELHQNRSDLEVVKDKFKKNTVLITCRGKVYGIGLFAGIILTVSHVIPEEESDIFVQSGNQTFTARVLRMSRKRDLAILAIQEKQFPPFADLRKMLVPEELFNKVRSGYFIRPTNTPLIIGNKLSFISNVASPKIDSTNPLYRLESQFWMFDTVGIHDPSRIFKSGDCGLPLVTIMNNEIKLVGIHNALHMSGYAWFSSITLDDLKEIKANAMCDLIIHQVSHERMVVDPKTKEALQMNILESKYAKTSPLKIFGWSKALCFYSKPTVKKRYINVAEKYFENPKLPAAITIENVRDTKDLYPDKLGNINPLFSQAVKYAEKLPTEGTFDAYIDEYVTDIIKTYYRKVYGVQKELKLHEVINGYDNLKEIEMTTSPGPKMKKHFGIHTKIPEKDPEILFINLNKDKNCKPFYKINMQTPAGKALYDDYYLYLSAIKQGTPPMIISKDNAKVELLPKEKVFKGKVRLFNELDLSINMILKTFFGSFLEQVIEKHQTEMFCIGTNPFVDATSHMMYFNSIEGEYLNADFKALDKSTTKHLIDDFVECSLQDFSFEVRNTIAKMLTYRLHTMDGHLYFVDSGNCSGSYVTTLMNCHTVLKVSLYTFCRKWQETYKMLPTYGEIMRNCVIRILGDDAIRKFSNLIDITDADLTKDAATYGLTQTPAKVEGLISFCSRTYVKIEENIYFPKLTQDSIVATLFWFNSLERQQIEANIFVALLEASLHDEEFYQKCKNASIDIANKYNIQFDYIPYKIARETFVAYIRGYRSSPIYKAQENLESQLYQNIVANSTKLRSRFLEMADMWLNEYIQKRSMQPPTFHYEATGVEHALEWSCLTTVHTPDGTFSASGFDKTKQLAKKQSCEIMKNMLTPQSIGRLIIDGKVVKNVDNELLELFERLNIRSGSKITYELERPGDESTSNSDIELGNGCTEHHNLTCAYLRRRGGPFDSKIQFYRWIKAKYTSIITVTPEARTLLMQQRCVTKVEEIMHDYIQRYMKHETETLETKFENASRDHVTSSDLEDHHFITPHGLKTMNDLDNEKEIHYECYKSMGLEITPEDVERTEAKYNKCKQLLALRIEDESKSNADQPIEPASINQAATGISIGTLPSSTNPQPSGVVPAMTSSGEDIMANLQFAEHHVLQPVGAPNMLSVGAITFDIKNLIYQQFLDADIEFEITDDLVSGSVIMQVPYGVGTIWVNSYIRAYARLHGRYAGAIQYRFTVIGNPLFSGAIGIAWMPQAVEGSTVLISETQKYAYMAKGVTMPWNVIHTLHDGRQDLFYRRTDEVVDGNRPHLVVYLMMSLQNPLREGVKTRIRVASKLCNAMDPNPFVFSEAIPMREIPSQADNSLSPIAFNDLFINATNSKIHIYTDGTLASLQKFWDGTYYPEYNRSAYNISSCRRVGLGTNEEFSTNTSRLYGPAQDAGDRWANYITEWPMFYQQLQSLGWADEGKSVVSILVQSNMDAASFATLLLASPFGRMRSSAFFTESNWNQGKVLSGWAPSYLNRQQAPVKLFAGIYNNQSYVLRSGSYGGRPEYLLMGQYIKIITDQGAAIFYLISFVSNASIANPRSSSQMYGLCGLNTINDVTAGSSLPPYPYLNIDEQLGFTAPIDSLPLGYQAIRFTDVPASAMIITGYPGPTASDNATIARWFTRRGLELTRTKCIQFRLVDSISVRTVATVRYLQELNQFVINTRALSAYRVLPVLTSNLTIQSIITTDRTNDFAETDTSLWYERSSPVFLKNAEFETNAIGFDGIAPLFAENTEDESVSNASLLGGLAMSMGGGVMSGIGNAMNQYADRQFQQKMQGNQFAHEMDLQGNMFNFQQTMQGNNFDFQKMMQQGNFGQEQLLQERGYQNDLGLLQSSHMEQRITNQQQSQNRMTERGLSARSQFLTNHAPGASVA